MILITVTGQTKLIRSTLGSNKFQWKPKPKEWIKIVSEGSLNHTLDLIMPEIATIMISLQKVDVHGNPLSPDILKFCLNDVESKEGTILEIFERKLSSSLVSPVSPSVPTESKKKEWKKLPGINDSFF